MIDFKSVELDDKEWINPLLAAADMRGCHQNFTNIFIWSAVYNHKAAQFNNYLVVKTNNPVSGQHYFFPAGTGDLRPVLEAMRQDAAECGHSFKMIGVSPENIELLECLFPGSFEFIAQRDDFDYVYYLEKLVSLAGKKLQAKRNHINRFKAGNQWSFEMITQKNLFEVWEMNLEWCEKKNCKDDKLLAQEDCAVRRCFDHYGDLNLEGGLLRQGDRVIAYTIGEVLNSDTYVIHIEKAFSEIQGAYQMINREFAAVIQQTYPQIVYVNREEDVGFEGLRKAKLSYYPDRMEEKYLALFRE